MNPLKLDETFFSFLHCLSMLTLLVCSYPTHHCFFNCLKSNNSFFREKKTLTFFCPNFFFIFYNELASLLLWPKLSKILTLLSTERLKFKFLIFSVFSFFLFLFDCHYLMKVISPTVFFIVNYPTISPPPIIQLNYLPC